jgi:hypothetical protein
VVPLLGFVEVQKGCTFEVEQNIQRFTGWNAVTRRGMAVRSPLVVAGRIARSTSSVNNVMSGAVRIRLVC